jgi:hypothetical protein
MSRPCLAIFRQCFTCQTCYAALLKLINKLILQCFPCSSFIKMHLSDILTLYGDLYYILEAFVVCCPSVCLWISFFGYCHCYLYVPHQ